MNGKDRSNEGHEGNFDLVESFHLFEVLCEEEGPGAADEGELARLKQAMTDAYVGGDRFRFLDTLCRALALRDGYPPNPPSSDADS